MTVSVAYCRILDALRYFLTRLPFWLRFKGVLPSAGGLVIVKSTIQN